MLGIPSYGMSGERRIEIEIHIWEQSIKDSLRKIMAAATHILWGQQVLEVSGRYLVVHTIFDFISKIPRNDIIAFLPYIDKELQKQSDNHNRNPKLKLFVSDMKKEFESVIDRIGLLRASNQIEFDLLWAIYIPGEPLMAKCPITNVKCGVRYLNGRIEERGGRDRPGHDTARHKYWLAECERVDFTMGGMGWAMTGFAIKEFSGTKALTELEIYPAEEKEWTKLKELFINRAAILNGLYHPANNHKQYDALAYYKRSNEEEMHMMLKVGRSPLTFHRIVTEVQSWKGHVSHYI